MRLLFIFYFWINYYQALSLIILSFDIGGYVYLQSMKKRSPNNLYIKFWRNNIFLNLTTSHGKVLLKCSCGFIKSEKQKNLIWSLVYLIKYLKIRARLRGNLLLNLIFEGAINSSRVDLIYSELLKWNFIIVFVRMVDKIPHNGCRSKTKRTKLRKRSYLR